MNRIDILYEDEQFIVVNKPAGLAVQGGKGVKNSLDRILAEARKPAPLLVHRLDKDTSGVIITAKTKDAAANLSRIIGTRKAVKKYIAICLGSPEKNEGTIAFDLDVHGSVKKSETKYRVIKHGKLELQENGNIIYSILEIELGTGRMHQIRRHLAMNGNPVLGDDKYGDFSVNKKLRKIKNRHLLLHAFRLKINDINLDIQAPLPDYFKPLID